MEPESEEPDSQEQVLWCAVPGAVPVGIEGAGPRLTLHFSLHVNALLRFPL